MATQSEHNAKWRHNRAFLGTIGDEYADWMIVVMFYAALQAVETLFAHDGTRVHTGHEDRNRTLKTVNRYKQVWRDYRPLYDAARTARYDPTPEEWLSAADVRTRLSRHLYGIEQSVLKLTGSADRLEPLW